MNNDIVTKARLNAALGTEGNMGFEHNDIVTVDKMNEAIAEGGGGGETAQVTFINMTSSNYDETNPACYEANALGEGSPATTMAFISVDGNETATFTVPLYKGTCLWKTEESLLFETSGDIDIVNSSIVITGDGTITITDGT